MSLNIFDFFFPKFCFGCGRPGTYLCYICEEKIIFTRTALCPVCEKPSPYGFTHPVCFLKKPIDGMTVMGDYSGILQKLIYEFKYKNVYTLAEILAGLFVKHSDAIPYKIDFLTSIPMHKTKQQERGYNQAEILAQEISRKINIPYVSGVLIKIQPTKPQMSISDMKQRKENIRGAFTAGKNASIKGKRVGIVDDVSTSGATVFEAARILKKNGAKMVWGIVLARNLPINLKLKTKYLKLICSDTTF